MLSRPLLVLLGLTAVSSFTTTPQQASRRVECYGKTEKQKAKVVDYAAMSLEELGEEFEATKKAMFAMNLEKWQNKKASFAAHEYRDLKKKIARLMPHLEQKTEESKAT